MVRHFLGQMGVAGVLFKGNELHEKLSAMASFFLTEPQGGNYLHLVCGHCRQTVQKSSSHLHLLDTVRIHFVVSHSQIYLCSFY